ncbi:hypothetical protein HF1_13240 [Mycoplasma haemofelis str. Langford 1]|uniref:Uncharacterized protein n=1 Tax=Mycoplasma haemofelis (strain Langford 1) TaxID=941640 RepID=E8ZJL1_MYCHL|nr:hypothetical protein [Mycoplasma haemofelis]CBY93332.1 hypothetical protein HF1_13240 [Mycoplasma haemofelis str. Langford 1]
MTPLASKTLAGLGGLAAVGGGGALAWQQGAFSSSPKSIKERLIDDKYEILDQGSSKWTEIFNVYKGDGNTKWKFENDGISNSSQNTDIPKLKGKCQEILNKISSDEKSYSLASKWCVVPRKLNSFLDSASFLNDQETENESQAEWKKILDKYTATKTAETKYAMSDVTLEVASGTSKDADNIKKIKKGCQDRKEKYNYSLDFEDSLKEVKSWCTKEAAK